MIFILISVSICEKSFSRGNFILKCICTVELHIYSRSNFLYEKILRTTCEERRKEKVIENGKSRFRLLYIFFFFFPRYFLLHLFPSSLFFSFLFDAVFIRTSSVNASMHRRHLFPSPLSARPIERR